jgi:hypothetical protein
MIDDRTYYRLLELRRLPSVSRNVRRKDAR